MATAFEDHCWQDVVSPEVLDIYTHYQRDTHIGRHPAVLAIDLYNMVFQGGPIPVEEVVKEYPSSCGIHAWNAVEPIRELLALARARGFPVIYTTNETRPEANGVRIRATNRRSGAAAPDAFDIHERFRPEPNDLVVYKQRASAFYGTPLAAHLVQLGVDSLIVCGESTSGCVRASVVDAYSHGFHTSVAEEGCFDRSMLSHKVNLFDMHHKYADVMHMDEIRTHMEAFQEV